MARTDFDWTPERVTELMDLIRKGVSRGQIARDWGISRAAVIAKAQRLDLVGKNPVRPMDPDNEALAIELWNKGASNNEIRTKTGVKHPADFAAKRPDQCIPRQRRTPPAPTTARDPDRLALFRRVTECCFPLGDTREKTFRFCGDPADPGRPYCSTHAGIAYVKQSRDQNAMTEMDAV